MKFSKGEFDDESQEAKCFLKCFAYKLKFFNTAGEFQKEELLDYTQFIAKDGIPVVKPFKSTLLKIHEIFTSQAKELVDQCMETVQKGEDECDYAFQSYKCFWDGIKNAPEETAKDISGRFPIYTVLGFDHLNDEEEEVAEEKNVE